MHFLREEVAFPDVIARILSRSLWGTEKPSPQDIKQTAKALKGLWPILAKERGQQTSKHYSGDASFAEAYAAYYLTANMMKVPAILEEMRLFGISPVGSELLRWLDVGTGPGTAFWGLAFWAARNKAKVEFLGLEQSQHFLRLATPLARELMTELNADISANWASFKQSAAGKDSSAFSHWLGKFDPHVLSFMNSIGEIASDITTRRELMSEWIDALARRAKADGKPRWLVLIEPGSQAASRELLELRESIRQNAEVKVWLPCLSARPCGALAKGGDWCHEEVAYEFPAWLNELGVEAGLRKEALLFSYLVCSVGVHPEPKAWPSAGLRIVSQMMKEKGRIECFLCTEDSKKRARVLDSKRTDENTGFISCGRGTVFQGAELDEKGSVIRFQEAEIAGGPDLTVFPKPR